ARPGLAPARGGRPSSPAAWSSRPASGWRWSRPTGYPRGRSGSSWGWPSCSSSSSGSSARHGRDAASAGGAAASHRRSALRLLPDAAVVQETDLALDDLVAVLGVLHRRALEVEVLGIDRLLVEQLVQLGPDVLEPVVPLSARPVVAERLDVDDAGDVGGAGAVVLTAHDPALVVDDERSPAERVDRGRLLGEEVVRAHVGRHDVNVFVERTGPALDLEHVVAGGRVRIGRAVDHLGAVEGQRPRVLRIRSLIGHHDAEPPDLGVGDGPEGVEIPAVLLDPPVVDVVRTHRLLDREQRRDLVMLEDELATGIDDEADVEVAVLEVGVPRLGLGHHEGAVLPGDLGELLRLLAGN